LGRAGPSTIQWRHQWPRAQCAPPAVKWDDKSRAEFWEEFSEAAVDEGSCSHGPAGRICTSRNDVAIEKNRRACE
jgi:hypothetical protein